MTQGCKSPEKERNLEKLDRLYRELLKLHSFSKTVKLSFEHGGEKVIEIRGGIEYLYKKILKIKEKEEKCTS
jgi:hypothetical protein